MSAPLADAGSLPQLCQEVRVRTLLPFFALLLATGCGTVASAPPELGVAALTFQPSSGKARIYVYRPAQAFGSAARLKVAIDSQFIGKTASGTFLMVEVMPGTYRVSGLTSESNRGVAIEAIADSSYFFKLWPRMGFMSAQSGLKQVDAVEGMEVVRA